MFAGACADYLEVTLIKRQKCCFLCLICTHACLLLTAPASLYGLRARGGASTSSLAIKPSCSSALPSARCPSSRNQEWKFQILPPPQEGGEFLGFCQCQLCMGCPPAFYEPPNCAAQMATAAHVCPTQMTRCYKSIYEVNTVAAVPAQWAAVSGACNHSVVEVRCAFWAVGVGSAPSAVQRGLLVASM